MTCLWELSAKGNEVMKFVPSYLIILSGHEEKVRHNLNQRANMLLVSNKSLPDEYSSKGTKVSMVGGQSEAPG